MMSPNRIVSIVTDNDGIGTNVTLSDLIVIVTNIQAVVRRVEVRVPQIKYLPTWPPVEIFFGESTDVPDDYKNVYQFFRGVLSDCGYPISALLSMEIKTHEPCRSTIFSLDERQRLVSVH